MADSEIADLINAVKEHRKFKQLACYSIQVYSLSQQPMVAYAGPSMAGFGFRLLPHFCTPCAAAPAAFASTATATATNVPPPPPLPLFQPPSFQAMEKSIEHTNVRWRENIELAISLDAADVVCDILKRHQGNAKIAGPYLSTAPSPLPPLRYNPTLTSLSPPCNPPRTRDRAVGVLLVSS